MNEELLKNIAIEIEKACPFDCPCENNCQAANDEECMNRILNWLNSEECTDTIIRWVRLGLKLQNTDFEGDLL